MEVINVTITTDTICPWCYVGKKRFERAVADFLQLKGTDNVEVHVKYQPFQIDLTLPETAINKLEHFGRKFGRDRFAQMNTYLDAIGEKEGIKFRHNGPIVNSIASHRLVKYAGTLSHDAQDKVINTLYRFNFEEEKNIGDVDVLVEAGKAGGVDEEIVQNKIVGGDLMLKETLDDIKNANASGISGVPHFVIDGKGVVSGAQESKTFVQLFQQL
ncbi:hypothetical protein HK100_000092 [Physocladia obscura]|uniref:DSBA-like thioredoxin domain-containing protein n=1 Tax=Physocladia obscura TaxID=109957 RepID=A0AAD5XJX7_9FUNG|nr:hypothetical protein HK100_000092 [Physocladia obscura]